MQTLFLSKRLSIIARDKGFREKCFAYYDLEEDNDGFNLVSYEDDTGKTDIPTYENFEKDDRDKIVLAPLLQQITRWLREKDIRITEVEFENNLWTLMIGRNNHILGRFPLDIAIEKAFRHVLPNK